MEHKFTFVVIGGGVAGVSCVEILDYLPDEEDTVLLITSSPVVKVARSVFNLTRNLVDLDVAEEDVGSVFKNRGRIKVLTDMVTGLDHSTKTITTKNNLKIIFERLCICAGGQPSLIDDSNPYVLGIRDTESVAEFQKRISTARKILVVGNGGIASEIIHEVKNVEKIWVVKDDFISKTFLDPGASEFLLSGLVKSDDSNVTVVKRIRYELGKGESSVEMGVPAPALGPDWHSEYNFKGATTSESVMIEYEALVDNVKINKNGEWPVSVKLTNGKTYDVDFVVSATGVIPNSKIFKAGNDNLELASDGGILVDYKMETSLKDVFAAGDICTAGWDQCEHWHQMRLWNQARTMGFYAAKCMVASYKNIPFPEEFCFEIFGHVTKLFGFKVTLLGLYNGQKLGNDYEILLRVTKGSEYIKLVTRNGRVQGAILIGDTGLEEMCENLILNQTDITPYGIELLNPEIDIEDFFD